MVFRITPKHDFPENWSEASDIGWLFGWQCFMLSSVEWAVFRGVDMQPGVLEGLSTLGARIQRRDDGYHLTRSVNPEGPVRADFASLPLAAIPYAVTCAMLGVRADIHGLHALVNLDGRDLVSPFQHVLYKSGVHSDFCDGSKLKILDGHPEWKSSRPMAAGDERIMPFLVPLAIRLGPLEMEMDERAAEGYQGLWSAAGFEWNALK